jgi:hypothetical protein
VEALNSIKEVQLAKKIQEEYCTPDDAKDSDQKIVRKSTPCLQCCQNFFPKILVPH